MANTIILNTIILNDDDYITKDNKSLSHKQIIILCKNNIFNVNDMTYEEVSNKIGDILNKINRNKVNGDRGFDDDPYYDYNCPYSEGDLC